MLNGFDRAVGPIQPSESADRPPYRCHVGQELARANPDEGWCYWMMFDGGEGKTYAHCSTHGYGLVAIDWTAPSFAGGVPLAELLDSMRASFTVIRGRYADVDDAAPALTQMSFGEVLSSIATNLQRIAERVENDAVGQ